MLPSAFAHRVFTTFRELPMNAMSRVIAALLAGALLTACETREAPAPARAVEAARPVVVQGAMDVEIKKLAGTLENVTEEKVRGWTFWKGTIDGYPVVVSKTLKGMSNAAAATALAAERYRPVAIINQERPAGTSPACTSTTSFLVRRRSTSARSRPGIVPAARGAISRSGRRST
jgi:hypothetical protein